MFGLLKKLRGSDAVRSRNGARRYKAPRVSPSLEGLEVRDLNTFAIGFNVDTVMIDGLASATQANVTLDTAAWWNPFDDLVRVSLTDRSTNQVIETAAFPAGNVQHIVYHGGDGDDVFVNSTSISSVAF